MSAHKLLPLFPEGALRSLEANSVFLLLSVAFGTAVIAVYVIYYVFFHPLASIPGPTLAKLTDWWRYHHYCQGTLHLVQAELFKRYNSVVVRVGPNSIIFSSPEAYKKIHSLDHGLERGDFYTMIRFGDRLGRSMFSAETRTMHQIKRKKLVSVAMTRKAFSTYEHAITKHRDIWLEQIKNYVTRQGSQIDVAYLDKALAFDTLYAVLTGDCPEFQSIWNTPRFEKAIRHKEWTNNTGFGWGFMPSRAKVMDRTRIPKILFHRRKYDRYKNPILRTMIFWHWLDRCENILLPAAKKSAKIPTNVQNESNVLKTLVSVPDDDPRKMQNDEEIMTEIRTMLFAGPGTLAAALTSILYDLTQYPSWQAAIRMEVQQLPSDQFQTIATSAPLLNAFMDESLRLRPIGPLAFPLSVSSPAASIIPTCSIPLPIGTEIGAVPYVVNRDALVWGPDADNFKPDRWLIDDNAQLRRMREVWAVFGRGAKACPGEQIALSLIQQCVAGLLRRYIISANEGALKGRCNFEMTYQSLVLSLEPLAS